MANRMSEFDRAMRARATLIACITMMFEGEETEFTLVVEDFAAATAAMEEK